MDYLDYLNSLLKYMFINLMTCYVSIKVSNFKQITKKQKVICIVSCVLLAILYAYSRRFFPPSSIFITLGLMLGFLFKIITKLKLDYCLIVSIVASAITIMLYIISIFIALFIKFTCFPLVNNKHYIILFLAILVETVIITFIFKRKRFKNGLSFLKNANNNYDLLIFLSGMGLLIFACVGRFLNDRITEILLLSVVLVLISTFRWIKRSISNHYKKLLVQDTIQSLEAKLKEEIEKNAKMKEELQTLATINHKYSSRILALELAVKDSQSDVANLVKSVSEEYSNELGVSLNNIPHIHKTDLLEIDTILHYFSLECAKKKIPFKVMVKSNIKEITKKSIPFNLFETLLADLLKNAMIAIEHGKKEEHEIFVQFDVKEFLEIRIYDTGIEFEKDTLLKLRKNPNNHTPKRGRKWNRICDNF